MQHNDGRRLSVSCGCPWKFCVCVYVDDDRTLVSFCNV